MNGCRVRQCWSRVRCAAANGAYCENFSLFTGKQGFKGPVDQGVNGDFGYQRRQLGHAAVGSLGIGYQVGRETFRSATSRAAAGRWAIAARNVLLLPACFAAPGGPADFRAGAVVDYLRDDFYIRMNLSQVRAELSYFCRQHEVGFWGAFHGNTSTNWANTTFADPTSTTASEATNQYNGFLPLRVLQRHAIAAPGPA